MHFVEKYRIHIGIVLVLIMVGSGIFLFTKSNKNSKLEVKEPERQEEVSKIHVDIEGAIKNPGVYELAEGSILEDLIQIAGGFSKTIDSNLVSQTVNRAQKLKDGDKFYIPMLGDEISAQAARGGVTLNDNYGSVQGAETGKININIASQTELESLPGIGEVKASSIISYRESHGGFKSIEEIKNVKGIGDATFDNIKDLIIV
ncbi:helix-hairpin-helix domain-containing protein [Patescibacteria group bacterium]